jgi:hypothetical protein
MTPDHFHTAIEALKQTAAALIIANEGIKNLADAMASWTIPGDSEESIHHLETLVLALTSEVRGLRDEVRELSERLEGPAL